MVSESRGTWQQAEEVPGTAALNPGGIAEILSVSCASAGDCSAGGYVNATGHGQAFVVSETGGTWQKAQLVPGIGALNKGNAAINSVSCASAGNCSAGGYYTDGSFAGQAFVVSKTSGTWHTAEEVPGTAALNTGGSAEISSVSCATAGNCSAGGVYFDGSGHLQVFVVNDTSGTWQTAEEVPGSAALNTGGTARIFALSCGSAGNCSAGGYYTDSSGSLQALVVSETSGTWQKAKEVPGTAALNTGGDAEIFSVSCASGSCSAGGFYTASLGRPAFVVNKT